MKIRISVGLQAHWIARMELQYKYELSTVFTEKGEIRVTSGMLKKL